MQKIPVSLADGELSRLDQLAARLQLTREDAAAHMLRAAIEALEHEDRFEWPLFLRAD